MSRVARLFITHMHGASTLSSFPFIYLRGGVARSPLPTKSL